MKRFEEVTFCDFYRLLKVLKIVYKMYPLFLFILYELYKDLCKVKDIFSIFFNFTLSNELAKIFTYVSGES